MVAEFRCLIALAIQYQYFSGDWDAMECVEEAIVLKTRPYGEKNAITSLFMGSYGRSAGFTRSGHTARMRAILQPGNRVHAHWRGRLAEHLGTVSCKLLRADATCLFADQERLTCLAAACAMVEATLPERVPYPVIFATLEALIWALITGQPGWEIAYVRWEMTLIAELGYSLDRRGQEEAVLRCSSPQPAYVLLRTGQVISMPRQGEEGWRLLSFLEESKANVTITPADIAHVLRLTSHFLRHYLFIRLPKARRDLAAQCGVVDAAE
ncbi:DNA recombination and repair protein RecO [invertebrate metagenome]|uniref:DNA repair protein RecO n=1 Tax=invertebrate metagenome TaxID=1711999 RepID=A0A484H5L3_9ZZZZ